MKISYSVRYDNISINTYNKALAVKLAKRNNGTIYKIVKKEPQKTIDTKL